MIHQPRSDYRCPECGRLMFWESDDKEALLCKKCGCNFSPYEDLNDAMIVESMRKGYYDGYDDYE